jgi:hypothetical protein
MRDRIGLYGPRWWSHEDAQDRGAADDPASITLCDECALPLQLAVPAFVTPEDRVRAGNDVTRLRQRPGGPAYLGTIILPWAEANPRDPRVPEALYLLVRATRYGETDTKTSRAAYLLLHNRYRRNPWTAKTPLWYGPDDER